LKNNLLKKIFDEVGNIRVTNEGFGEPALLVKNLTEYKRLKKKYIK